MSTIAVWVLAFPALATFVTSRFGRGALAWVTFAPLGLIFVLALALASARFGNRLAAKEGYASIAAGTLALFALWIAMPILLSAGAIHLLSRAARPWYVVFLGGFVAALGGLAAGVILSLMWFYT